MAEVLTAAIHDRLAADPAVTSKISTYNGKPAIFGGAGVPEDVELPFITIDVLSDAPLDTKTTRGWEQRRLVTPLVPATGSELPLDRLATAVTRALHRRPLSYQGVVGWLAEVEDASPAPTDETMDGRALTVRLAGEEA